ncbi:Larval/pupal cuticle protein H1C [Orchesella cincta]|uniref:Larval/pupal cuticle protein H1C n=1 Tax=Orchesella cincta TaxID=48709 RepID=A0A1D2MCP3_ORCCI|nr:Larval/pupal cuticle protein H1C [Orchesella cincta]
MYKVAIVLAFAAVASAGFLDTHVGSQVEQTVRGFGGQSSLSHQAKTVNSAYSTSNSYKTKATNNAYAVAAPVAYAQPQLAYAQQYAQPQLAYAAQPAYARAVASPVGYAAAPVAGGLLGVRYSPVTAGVATQYFDGFGVHYGY